MMNLLILSAAKALKGAILGGLAFFSWGIHTLTADVTAHHTAPAHRVVVGCEQWRSTVPAVQTARARADVAEARALRASKQALRISKRMAFFKLTEIVPPIRVEE